MYRCMYVEIGSLDKSPGHARDEKLSETRPKSTSLKNTVRLFKPALKSHARE